MKDFTLYPEALALKELGFNEPCFGRIYADGGTEQLSYPYKNSDKGWDVNESCSAPTYSQAFRFFREKYGLHQYIKQYYGEKFYFQIEDMVYPRRWDEYTVEMLRAFNESTSQEESELACLQKLIEIVKNKEI